MAAPPATPEQHKRMSQSEQLISNLLARMTQVRQAGAAALVGEVV
jgi:hypothetical protein